VPRPPDKSADRIAARRRPRRCAEPRGGRILQDITTEHPRILFVGINPGRTSGRVGHHFAGPGNPFWRLLHAAGLVPEVLRAEEDGRLAEFGLALVNLCPRVTRTAAELTAAELRRGRARLVTKIAAMQPEVVALVGVTLYPIVCGSGGPPGPGAKPGTLGGARVFVLPNPSGLNASFPSFAAKLVWFEQLAAFARDVSPRR
jgi:TDG/mug DNA glycosylase family protein